jgi:general secretion pathway protein L
MLRDFFQWWGQQLAACLPDRLSNLASRQDALIVVPAEEAAAVTILLRRKGGLASLGCFGLDNHGLEAARQATALNRQDKVVLRLEPSYLLEKRLSLPLAVEPELDRVLGFEMDRETPFAADEVYWTATVKERNRRNGRLNVLLSLVPRSKLASLTQSLATVGLAPHVIEVEFPDEGDCREIRLAPDRSGRRGGLIRFLAAASASLAAVAILLPFALQEQKLAQAERNIAALRPRVEEAEALRRQIADSGRQFITAERVRIGNALQILAVTTATLPDDAYLTDLYLRTRKLSITGQAASASRVFAALAANPAYSRPTFTAPVTRIEGLRPEVFSIDLDVQ